jgi:hypothetical protein
MDVNKLRKAIEAINTYYAFAVLLYVAALYVAGHSQYFLWLLIVITPLIAGWTGYILNNVLSARRQRYGFRVLSDNLTYILKGDHRASLKYVTKLQADANHLMVFPVGTQWTGKGEEHVPVITGEDQKLLGVVRIDEKSSKTTFGPYIESVPTEGNWHYWFVGLKSPLYKGEQTEIKYSQDFEDTRLSAKPCLYYLVRTSMKTLDLQVKFPDNKMPKEVTCRIVKPGDSRRSYPSKGIIYDPDKNWATWRIDNPKRGYCYRIEWQ